MNSTTKTIKRSKHQHKKTVLLDWDFQFRIIKLSILVGLVSTAVTSFVLLWPLYKFEILKIPKFLPTPIMLAMVVALLTNMLSLGLMGLYLSHRISGPLYSVVRKLRLLGHGNFFGELKLRKNDELKYLMRNINHATSQLADKTRDDISKLELLLSDVQKLNKKTDSDELKQIESRLQTMIGNWYKSIGESS